MKPLWSVSYFRQVCGDRGEEKQRVRDAAAPAARAAGPRPRYLHELLAGPELLAAEQQHEVLLRGQHVRQLQRGGGCQGRRPRDRGEGASGAPAGPGAWDPGSLSPASWQGAGTTGSRWGAVARPECPVCWTAGRCPQGLGPAPAPCCGAPLGAQKGRAATRPLWTGRTQVACAAERACAPPGPREAPNTQGKATRNNRGPVEGGGGDRPRGGDTEG